MSEYEETKKVSVLAKNKKAAYDKAVYDIIPNMEGHSPYYAYVYSVTYQNGKYKLIKNGEGWQV
jgi:hypothetical protein